MERDKMGVIFGCSICCLMVLTPYLKSKNMLASWIGPLLNMGSWEHLFLNCQMSGTSSVIMVHMPAFQVCVRNK